MPPDRLDLRRDAATGVEAVRGRFAGKAYDMHRHEEWLVGVTDHGVQDFHCRGARRRSTPGRIILIEPEEAHDGEAGAPVGFSYRMLYLPQGWLADALETVPGFRASLSDDPALGRAIRAAVATLAAPTDRLSRDAALDRVLDGLRPHLGVAPPPWRRDDRVAKRAREILHATLAEEIGADRLAQAAGAPDRFHLARAFRARFGTAPHAYRVQQRLLAARRMLGADAPPATVAAACGFADQSHLGRWFRRAYGVTPAAYRAACTGVPDPRPATR